MPLLKLECQAASAEANTALAVPKISCQPRTSVSCASAAVKSAPAAAAVTSPSRDSLNDVDLNASRMSYEENGLDICKLPGTSDNVLRSGIVGISIYLPIYLSNYITLH